MQSTIIPYSHIYRQIQDTIKKEKERIEKSFEDLKKLKNKRKPDIDLIVDCFEFAQDNEQSNEILNAITIYRLIFETVAEFDSKKLENFDAILNEMEANFASFLQTGFFPERLQEIKYALKK